MAATAKGEVVFDVDFEKDNVTDLNETVQSSATQDILNRHGGWWRMVIAGDEADAVMLAGERVFEIDEGFPVIFEVRLRTSNSDVSAIWVGSKLRSHFR